MAGFVIVMCGVSGKDARMVEIVVSRAPNMKYKYELVQAANASRCDIVLMDAQASTAKGELASLQAKFGKMPVIYISDDGTLGEPPHRIVRRTLLLNVLRTLDEIGNVQMRGVVAAPAAPASIPVNVSGAQATSTSAPIAAPIESRKLEPLSALIVDDSLTVRTQLQGALDRIGIKGQLADGGQAAIESVQRQRFELIFLDVVMPGMDGYTLCRQIKSAPTTRNTPIVMLTSRSSPFDRARGALAGCDTYLTKPIDLKSFYRAVDKVLLKAFKDNRDLMTERGYKTLALG
jgi:two-component system, cell cycle response regulator